MKLLIVAIFSLASSLALGDDSLFQTLMTAKQQQETGISKLTPSEQGALEIWIKTNFTQKIPSSSGASSQTKPLILSLNVGEGARLGLSDGTAYEVAPSDRFYAAYWITPFQVTLAPSEDPEYPLKLTNLNTGTAVRVKQISKEELMHPTSSPETPKQTPPDQKEPSSS